MKLEDIVYDCLSLFNYTSDTRIPITRTSIPILYFGDLPRYQKSKHKIITVGLNPSHHEFPKTDRFSRFRKAEQLNLTKQLDKNEIQLYLGSLNDYYKENPYNWFSSFEPILNGLKSSYYPNSYPSKVLHTDICTPFATDVTWSMLSPHYQNILSGKGSAIWRRLVEYQEPDLMLVSVAREHLNRIKFSKSKWSKYTRITETSDGSIRSKPYDIEVAEFIINSKKGFLVFGQAAQKPFGTLSNIHKQIVGEKLHDLLS